MDLPASLGGNLFVACSAMAQSGRIFGEGSAVTVGVETCRRVLARDAVLKGAQIVFGDSVIDCVVVNISAEGARVRTASVVPVPDRFTLRVRGGAVISAVRRWSRGTEIGLAFVGTRSLSEGHAQHARAIFGILFNDGLHVAIQQLRAVNFFDDPELRATAEEAAAAHARLEAVLKARAAKDS